MTTADEKYAFIQMIGQFNSRPKSNVLIVRSDTNNVIVAPEVVLKCYCCGDMCRGLSKVLVTEPDGAPNFVHKFSLGCPKHVEPQVVQSFESDNYLQFLREVELFGFSFIDNSTIAFKYGAMLSMVNRLIQRLPVEEQQEWRDTLNKIDPTPVFEAEIRKLEL